MAYETIVKEGNFRQTATGDYGFRLLEGGESSTAGEAFRAIQAIEGAVVTTTTEVGDAVTNLGIGEGTIIYGKFDSISCVSGKVLAYKAL